MTVPWAAPEANAGQLKFVRLSGFRDALKHAGPGFGVRTVFGQGRDEAFRVSVPGKALPGGVKVHTVDPGAEQEPEVVYLWDDRIGAVANGINYFEKEEGEEPS